MGPSIKDVRIFWDIFDTPLRAPPCRNFDPDLPNFYLLISCNIGISDLPTPTLKYSDAFYGWPHTIIELFLNVTGELLNVEGVVKEKWLELEKFRQPSSDAADRKLLNTVNIELKLISRSCCMDMHFCILYLIYVY